METLTALTADADHGDAEDYRALCHKLMEGEAALAMYQERTGAVNLSAVAPVVQHAENLVLHLAGGERDEAMVESYLASVRTALRARGVPANIADLWCDRILRFASIGARLLHRVSAGQIGTA